MKQHKKALLSVAAIAAIGTAGIGGTYAAFTDTETESTDFDSGSIVVGTTLTGFSTANMVPGDSSTGTLAVSNDGDNKIKTLTIEGDPGTTPIESPLGDHLYVTVTDTTTGDVVAEKTINQFNAAAPATLATNAGTAFSDSYAIKLELKSTSDAVDNTFQDKDGSETFTIKAVQRDGVVRTVGEGTIEL